MRSILFAGDFRYSIYDEVLSRALSKSGFKVENLRWGKFFNFYSYKSSLERAYYGFQNRYKIGPVINKLNKCLVSEVEKKSPDILFLNRAIHISPKTLKKIKLCKPALKVVGYNNDCPFSGNHPWWLFGVFKKTVMYFDLFFSYRESDIEGYRRLNCKNVELLLPYYDEEKIFPVGSDIPSRFFTDVVFIGHFEEDGRDKKILDLLKAGVKVKVYGTDWSKSSLYQHFKSVMGEISPIYGDEYNYALNGSKIALVFYSKKNNDFYTRRCFEIPATKTLMLSEPSEALSQFFKIGEEADLFNNSRELIDKVEGYLADPIAAKRVANNGYNRLMTDGHSSLERGKKIAEIINGLYQ